MIIRKIRFHSDTNSLVYDTELHGPWTLCECSLSSPVRQTNLVTIPGRDGEIDLAPAIGDVKYEPREFEAILECSEGSRADRSELIETLVNSLEGRFCWIFLPDDPLRYIQGYVDVEVEYNDINHARVRISARVDPWRYCQFPKEHTLIASATVQKILIKNSGGKKCVPTIAAHTLDASAPNLTVTCGEVNNRIWEHTFTSFAGCYPEELTMGYRDEFMLEYSGSGILYIRWDEASL